MEEDFSINFNIVLIKWDDAVADDISWKSVNDALDWSEDLKSKVLTVGFLLDENDEYVTVALSVMPLVEDPGHKDINVHGVFRIPKASISEMKILEKIENI